MKTHQERNGTNSLSGSLLRVGERREIATYLRDGTPWIADFDNGRGELFQASLWFSMGGGRMLAHATRRGEVEAILPLPNEVVQRIASLHRRMEEPVVGPAVRRALAMLVTVFRPAGLSI